MYPWVEPGEILVHIGPHKTGTTALQAAFATARPQLQELGVRYPGSRGSHWHAAAAAMGRRTGGGSVPADEHWDGVLTALRENPDERAFLSSEFFCEADDDAIARIVADLGRPVRVALTLRSFEKLLPSTWQQAVKTTRMPTYERWLHRVLDDPGRAVVWRRFDTVAMVERWARVVGPERVAAVVLDEGDPAGLLRDFEALLGLPGGVLVAPPVSNRSMTAAEIEMVRRVYAGLGDEIPESSRQRWLRRGGIVAMVESYRPDPTEPRIVTPAWAVQRARALQAELNERLPATGAMVIGEPARLVGTEPVSDAEPVEPQQVPLDPVAHLVTGVLLAAQEDLAGAERRLAAARERVARLRARKPKVVVKRVEVPADLTKASGKAMLRELARRAKPGRRRG